jgi:hypothetical protein
MFGQIFADSAFSTSHFSSPSSVSGLIAHQAEKQGIAAEHVLSRHALPESLTNDGLCSG